MARHGRTFPIQPHKNYQGRAGIYFNRSLTTSLSETVALAESFSKQPQKLLSESFSITETFSSIKTKVLTLTDTFASGTQLEDSYSESNYSGSQYLIYSGGNTEVGQTFTASQNLPLSSADFYLLRSGVISGTAVAKLYAITGTYGTNAVPTGSPLATSDAVSVSGLSSSTPALISFPFSGANQYSLVAGTNYAIAIDYNSGDNTHCVCVCADNTSPTASGNAFTYNGTYSANSSIDFIFYVYGSSGAALTDTISFIKTKVQTFTESFSLAESFSTIKSFLHSLTDTFSLTETFSSIKTKVKSLADTVNLSDTITAVKQAVRALTDTFTISESFTALKTFLYTLTDSISISEAFSTGKAYIRNLVDSISLSESITFVKAYIRVFVDSLSVIDTIVKKLNGTTTIWLNRVKQATTWVGRLVTRIFYSNATYTYDDPRLTYDQTSDDNFTQRTKPTTNWTNRTKP